MADKETCPTCGTEFGDESDYVLARKIGSAHSRYGNEDWYTWSRQAIGTPVDIDSSTTVVLVDKKVDTVEDQGNDNQKVYLVFAVGDRFFRKDGRGDSYGDVNWDGVFKEVFKTTETVVVFK